MAKFQASLYFSIDVTVLRPGTELPFNLRLHLPLNNHIVALVRAGEVFTQELAAKLKARKVVELFLLKEDLPAFQNYIKSFSPDAELPEIREAQEPDAIPEVPDAIEHEISAPTKKKSANLDNLVQDLSAPDLEAETALEPVVAEKKADPVLSSAKTLELVTDIFSNDPAAAEEAFEKAKGVTIDLIEGAASPENLLGELLKRKDQGHSATVSTYCVLFAMGLGYKEPTVLRNIAIAGLLHDVGFTQIPATILWTPADKLTAMQKVAMEKHVELGLKVLTEMEYTSNIEVIGLVSDHHEKFDGTGFPRGVRGFHFTEMAQILAFSDYLDATARGLRDGKKRTPGDSLEMILRSELNPAFPHVFNPDVLKRLVKWFKAEDGFKAMLETAEQQAAMSKSELGQNPN